MEFIFILFICLFILSILGIISALVIISYNIRLRKYISSHKEKVLVLRKALKDNKLSNNRKHAQRRNLKYFIDLQLANSEVISFEIKKKQFSSIITGENAIISFKRDKLLFYESKHTISSVFLDKLSDIYPFYHREKHGPQVLFYADFPSINILINSYEAILVDYSEIKEALSLIKKNPEEFFCLINKNSDILEIICIQNQFEIHLTTDLNQFSTYIEEEKKLLDFIELWMNERLNIENNKINHTK
jgi:hypothetical protein